MNILQVQIARVWHYYNGRYYYDTKTILENAARSNTKVVRDQYRVTISDPNFNAIEDRMLCRLASLSRDRFTAIADSQRKLLRGELEMKQATDIRDHLTLLYAMQNVCQPYIVS